MSVLHDIEVDEAEIAQSCRRHDVSRLWFFGSVLKPTFRVDSDIDVLVELKQPIGLFGLGGLQSELTGVLGREVHLTTLNSVPVSLRRELIETAMLLYAD